MATRTSFSSATSRAPAAAQGSGGKRPSSAPATPSSSSAPSPAAAAHGKKRLPSKTTPSSAAGAVPPASENATPAKKRSPSKASSAGEPSAAAKPKAKATRPPKAPARAEESAWQPLDEELLPIPHGLLCCICRELFQDPVATVDGHSYCRKCIKHWFDMYDSRLAEFYGCQSNFAPFSQKVPPVLIAPMTSLPLPARSLQPNVALKQAVEAYRESRPSAELRERERRDLKRVFDEMQARHEFILSDDAKAEVVQEMSRLRCRVLELEEQLCRANALLGGAKGGSSAAKKEVAKQEPETADEVKEQVKEQVKEDVDKEQVAWLAGALPASADDGWDSEQLGCNLGASIDTPCVLQLPYVTKAASKRPAGPPGQH